MIIVSQDKKQIINFNNIRIVEINNPNTWQQGFYSIDTYPECEDQQKWHIRLGKYATEERAKEVLQELINLNTKFKLYKTMPAGGNEQAIMLDNFSNNNIKFDTYEMPKE